MKNPFSDIRPVLKDFAASAKTAAKDGTDLIMFLIAAVLSWLDFSNHYPGAVGFLTFYLFFCLVRIGYFKNRQRV